MSNVFGLDFDKLEKANIDKKTTLDYIIHNTDNNFNFTQLQEAFSQNGFNEEAMTNALYERLKESNASGDLWISPKFNDLANHSSDVADSAKEPAPAAFEPAPEPTPSPTNPPANTMMPSKHNDFDSQEETNLSKSFLERGAEVLLGYESENVKKLNAKADFKIQESIAQNKSFDELSDIEKNRLLEQDTNRQDMFHPSTYSRIFSSGEERARFQYEEEKERFNILNIKNPKDLSPTQRDIIARDEGFLNNTWDYLFSSEEEILSAYKEKFNARNIIAPRVQNALIKLDTIHQHKSVGNLIKTLSNGKQDTELFENYLDDVETIAKSVGFDDIGYNKKGEIYFYKGENAYKVNGGFFDNFTNILSANAGSIAGGVGGSIAGFKAAPANPLGKTIGTIGGAAVGSTLGASADVLIANAYLNRENNFDELLSHALEEGALSIVGDVAALGIFKGGAKVLQAAKSTPLGSIADYTPVVGFAKRAIDGNASAAQKLIDKTYTKEQLEALKSAGESFGANLSFSGEKGKNPFISTFGESSAFAKAYENVQTALTLPTQKERQAAFIQAIRADDSGNLLAFLSEAAAQSPKARENMRSILNATTFQVKKQLDNLALNKGDIKAIFDELESGTKSSYDEAINKVISSIYDESYKVNLNDLKGGFKGSEFITHSPKLTLPKSDITAKISIEQWVQELAGLNPQKEVIADLQALYTKHQEIFNKPSEVFKLIQKIKTNPTYFYTNNQPNIALIGKMLEDGKLGKLGINKQTNQVRHATQSSKGQKEHERLVRRGGENPLAEWANPAQLAPTPNGEKSLLGGADSTTPLPNKQSFAKFKSNLEKDLTTEEIKEVVKQWDLSPQANANKKQKITFKRLSQEETELIRKDFHLKGKYELAREIDSHQIIHTLKQHGDESIERARGQEAVTIEDIVNYTDIAEHYDLRVVQDNGKILYAKQVNGHHIVLEEVLEGQDKLRFFDMWKVKGEINEQVLLSHSQRPNTSKVTSPSANMPSNTQPTPRPVFTPSSMAEPKGHDLAQNQAQVTGSADSTTPLPNKQSFARFKEELESAGINAEGEAASFLNFVEKNIYNDNGVSFTQLNNALKTLNAYYKEAKDPNFRTYIKHAMDSFLREDIKAGIEAIFSQNKSAYKDISTLYSSALSDYANMKEVIKNADKLKLRNATTTQQKALNSLLDLAKGQGDRVDNISNLTKALSEENRAVIELNMLQKLFTKSLYDEGALQVIDSGKFFKELQSLNNGTFVSKEAKDFINIMSGFDRLFKNDVLIAKALKPATTDKIGSSIATSIEGAVKFQVVKNAFNHLVRLMPHIPFLGGLNQKVQGAALRYHLQSALESSFNIADLKHTLKAKITKAPYTSSTKAQLDKILNRIDIAQDSAIEVAEHFAKEESKNHELRAQLERNLTPLLRQNITNAQTGLSAQISQTSIKKMGSDSALEKSLANGFSKEEHFSAASNIATLYQEAKFIITRNDEKNYDKAIKIHEFNANIENGIAKILVKESIDKDARRIYTLELQELKAVMPTNPRTDGDIIARDSKSLKESGAPLPPLENPSQSIAKNSQIAQDSAIEVAEHFAPIYKLREETRQILNAKVGVDIINQNDGRVAQITKKNIAKMTSDKAIQKSLDNGFSIGEHFRAVGDIDSLYQKAVFEQTHRDLKSDNPHILIHQYNAKLDNANALITLKETLDNQNAGNRIYSLELEALELKPSAPEPQGNKSMSRNTGRAEPVTPTDLPSDLPELPIIAKPELPAKALNGEANQQLNSTTNAQMQQTMQKFSSDELKGLLPYKPVHSQAMGEQFSKSRKLEPMHPNTPLENPSQSIAKNSQIAQDSAIEVAEHFAPIYKLREETKTKLQALRDKEIVHKSGIITRLSSAGINKMLSDKAIQKSVDNGFSIGEHFRAVGDIENLFARSDFLHTEPPKNQSADIVGVHRYLNTESLQDINAQALITLKESIQNGNRLYSLELEELIHPTNLNRSPKSKGVEDTHHKEAGATRTARLFENPDGDSTTNAQMQQTMQKFSSDELKGESALSTKTTSKLSREELESLPLATQEEFSSFLEHITQKDYKNTPEILKIATLNKDLQEIINNNKNANVFITRARAGHISEARKGEYNQALSLNEQKEIPSVINNAKEAYIDNKSGFIIPFADKNNADKSNLIVLDSDNKGNFLITAKKVDKNELENPKYKKLARAGVEPATTTPPKAEQKPTEAISLANKTDSTTNAQMQQTMQKFSSDELKGETAASLRGDEITAAIHNSTESTLNASNMSQPKQKTINAIDTYATSEEFKALSKDKQEAILSLKNIEPAPMPENIEVKDLENLLKHFNSKQDKAQREFYARLFEDTQNNPHITLEVEKEGFIRKEYIKAYEHKPTHDLYYIAITQEDDRVKVTGFPITKVKDVINQIKQAKSVQGHQGLPTYTTLESKVDSQSLEGATADSTTNAQINILDQALLEKQARELAAKEAQMQEELAKKQAREDFKNKQEAILQAKESASGKNELEQNIQRSQPIKLERVGNGGSVSIDDEHIYPLELVKVKSSDLKPNFNANIGTQTRTQHNQSIIDEIANHFNPAKVIGRGGFDDLPIILNDGQIIAGNHRAQGMMSFSPQSQEAYNQAIKAHYGIDLKNDELLVRIPKKEVEATQSKEIAGGEVIKGADIIEALSQRTGNVKASTSKLDSTTNLQTGLSDTEIRALAAISNKSRASNEGDKVINALGEYIAQIPKLNNEVIVAKSADEMALYVARKLDIHATSPDVENANKALLAYNTPSTDNQGLSEVFNTLHKKMDFSDFIALKEMYIKNAGALHNLSNDNKLGEALGLDSLNLKPFLLYAIKSSGDFVKRDRATNFSFLNTQIKELIHSTDEKGANPFIAQSTDVYENLIGDVLGAAFSRILRTENPTNTLFDILTNAKSELEKQVSPSLLGGGKSLKEADIFDFIEYVISTGASSEQSARMIDLLPALREKYNAFKDSTPPNAPRTKGELESAASLRGDEITAAIHKTPLAFTDSKGQTREIPQEVAQSWLEAFYLKDLQESYVPKFKPEVKQALDSVLQGQEIKLNAGSLLKLIERERLEFLPYIKDTLEHSDIVIRDKENALIFAKDIGQTSYFTSISKADNGDWVISTNSYKTINQLKNRVNDNGEVLYLSKEAPNILAEAFTAKAFSSELAGDSTTNAQMQQTMQKFSSDELKGESAASLRGDEITAAIHKTPLAFTDSKGQTREIPQEVAQSWLETFGLKSIDDTFVPNMPKEASEVIGKEIKINRKDLEKLIENKRAQYIPQVKATFEAPEAVFIDEAGDLLFAKTLDDKLFFVNVNRDYGESFKGVSLSPKKNNNLLKKLENAKEVILLDSKLRDSTAQQAFTGILSAPNKSSKTDSTTESIKLQANAHLGSGLIGGSVAGVEYDENGNLSFDPAKFALGFLGGAGGSKAASSGFKYMQKHPELKAAVARELANALADGWQSARAKYPILSTLEPRYIVQNERGRQVQANAMIKELEKEQKGIYNVAYNGKNATLIKQDLESVEDAILFEKGKENPKTNKGYGAKHIFKHTINPNAEGYVSALELVDIGKNLRTFLKDYEPFVDKNGARLYEWEDTQGVRFRLVVGDRLDKDPSTLEGAKALSLPNQRIITFYSDRNLKQAMKFKNPVLRLQQINTELTNADSTIDEARREIVKLERPVLDEWQEYLQSIGKDKVLSYSDDITETFETKLEQIIKPKEKQIEQIIAQKQALYEKKDILEQQIQQLQESQKPNIDFKQAPKSWKSIEKFKNKTYIEDLKEWHKDSHKSTKNKDGSPKIFYHGTKTKGFEVFEVGNDESGRAGIYFSTSPNIAKTYDIYNEGLYQVFLKYENPLVVDFKGVRYNSKEGMSILKTTKQKLQKDNDAVIFKNIRDDNQNGSGELADTIVIFNSNQIKSIDNKGLETEAGKKFFNESSPNIYHSNAHLGSGLIGGSVAGVEYDENGNLSFDPAKFALGFLGGAGGSKGIERITRLAKYPKARAAMERVRLKKDIMPKMQQGQRVDTQDVIKILENTPQKGDDMILIGKENLNAEVLEWAIKNNKKIPINELSESKARALGFRIPRTTKRTITPSEVIHTIKRHGEDSPLVKNGNQKAVTFETIVQYQDYADNADIKALTKDHKGKDILISGKQINGYYVVVEEIRKKINELSFKSMYFEKGDISKSNAFKNANRISGAPDIRA